MYGAGAGVTSDEAVARQWYRRAAEQGEADAQFTLGNLYYGGLGVPQDYAEAAKWFRQAADRGHARAQHQLSLMYQHGYGVRRNLVLAHMWMNLAVSRLPFDQGGLEARAAREAIAGRLTPEQLAEAHKLAREWKPTLGK
jgi:TPR repeat protein